MHGRGIRRLGWFTHVPWFRVAALAVAATAGCGPLGAEAPDTGVPQVEQVEQGLTQVTGFGSNPGNLQMFRQVPAGVPANAPLVVVLHGCTQNAAGMEPGGWTAASNVYKFYVVYAQQPSSNNPTSCFNWFEPGDIARGAGEALSIKQMVDAMKAAYSIDPARVFVTGFSAGAFMVPAMLATYPDVFAAGAINSGGPYRCANSMTEGFSCMSPGVSKTPAAWADLVRNAYPGYTGPRPRVSIWHGTNDFTVRPANLTESMKQWTQVHGIDQTPDTTDTVGGFPHKVYRDSAGTALVETYELTGMGHAVPVDPQYSFPGSSTACGATGAYQSDVNLCGVYHQALFFGLTEASTPPDDTTAPTVNVTAPVSGATVSGTVTVTASASDNVGVTRVDFYVDGNLVGTASTAPHAFSWNTTTVANGSHVLGARAFDAAGNSALDADTSVTVSNSGTTPTTVSFTSVAAEDGYVKANADGSAAELGTLTGLALGRGVDGKHNRSLLSFDTSGLPDTASITQAFLTLSYSSGSGDPWASPAGNTLVIDVATGTFNAAATETGDWGASATASAVAGVAKFTSGTIRSTDFAGAGTSAVNTRGRTQLRLRFAQNPAATAYLFVKDGANATLTVVYTP
ncbi:PHB depolymerase family esterase [Corallococcus exiguus]|uniref:extracellular catalytic domain type 1 short-chain-length polyhydroxyalkanoate depolymerase n=1 Tax=Corallococcus TaxID=83461 RepID=UPI000ECA764A|nr:MULTISPECIES: PHB depolymerase family esterase [Corallococcus]NPC72398.1 PHB depolymerase family esterase [Corallococcus exiguus]RKH97039.1 esterase [Corallococcus sp. AB038B]